MQLVHLTALSLLASGVVIAIPSASNTPGGVDLIFRNSASGLPWPLTNPDDIQQLVGHGVHCLYMAEKFNSAAPNNEMDQMHHQHCLRLIAEMLQYRNSFPEYSPPEYLCPDVRVGPADGFKADVNYNYNYNYKRDTAVSTEDAIERAHNAFDFVARTSKHQVDLFGLIAGQNLGDLLLREAKKEALNTIEAAYVAKWWTPKVVRMGTLGVYCSIDKSTNVLVRVLKGDAHVFNHTHTEH